MSDSMTTMRAKWIGRAVAWNWRNNNGSGRATGRVIDMTPAELRVELHDGSGIMWITPDEDGFEVLEATDLNVADYAGGEDHTDDATPTQFADLDPDISATFGGSDRKSGVKITNDAHAREVVFAAYDNVTGQAVEVTFDPAIAHEIAVWLTDQLAAR